MSTKPNNTTTPPVWREATTKSSKSIQQKKPVIDRINPTTKKLEQR
jgi:hypothetical protein